MTSRPLDWLSRIATVRPAWTLAVLAVVTIVLGAGITRLAPQADSTVFLPPDSEVAKALDSMEELFGRAQRATSATVIFRGDALAPDGLAQIDELLERVERDPRMEPALAPPEPFNAPTTLLARVLGPVEFGDLSQAEIDRAAASLPIDGLVGADVDGGTVAIARVRLLQDLDGDGETEDDEARLADLQLALHALAGESEGPLAATTLSAAVIDEEVAEASGSEMLVLMMLALAVIAALLLLFTRSPFDLLISVVGLVVTIVWVMGGQGWLGPNGLGVIGAPNVLTSLVPIMLIGLVVDYAIQTLALYREQRVAGEGARGAARLGLRAAIVPLSLAAVTTIVSFLTNISSPIPANADLGVVAGMGVAAGLIVMLTLLAASRALLDGRREARGRLPGVRPISGAVPGLGRAAEALGGLLARRPTPFIAAIAAATVFFAIAASQINTEFDGNQLLPQDGDAVRNVETLGAAFGGATEVVQVLVQAEITEGRTVRNVVEFSEAFADDLRRPEGVVGDIRSSLGLLLIDWITDDGDADARFDAELRAMALAADDFRLDPAEVQAIIDRLEALDPRGFEQVAVNDPEGGDALRIGFDSLSGDPERAERMVGQIDDLWFGDDEQLIATSGQIVGLEVVNSMTSSQTASIGLTVIAALVILCIFFWITDGRPALGFIAVAPIVLVLIWVLGTMTLAGISYNVITALITALSIGIGVDYTIHIIHRYELEFEQSHDPELAARRTLATTGSALLGSALTTALAFGVLVLSSREPMQQFGIVTAITISYSLIAATVVVPPAMILWAAYQNHRLRGAVARAREELPDLN